MDKTEMDDLLRDEILVDCYDRIEQNMSWFYFAQDELAFPFEADILLKKVDGRKETKRLEVIKLTTDDSDFYEGFELKLGVEIDGYLIEIPLSNLKNVEKIGRNQEIIETWKYWYTT